MVTPKTSRRPLTPEVAQAELHEELRQAERDFENGDFIELTRPMLDRIVATGECPFDLVDLRKRARH